VTPSPGERSSSITDAEWERWGLQDAYRGVLGFDTAALDAERRAAFFDSGREHIGRALEVVERHFGAPNWNGRALDFGCGVGRLLVPLCERFAEVVGVDISTSMLDIARKNLGERPGLSLVRGIENTPDPERGFDFVHSYIVMQHIRPRQGMPLMDRLLTLVRPGGIYAIHVTLGDLRLTRRILNAVRYRFRPAHWAYNLVRGRPLREPITEMNRYDAARIFDLLRSHACEPVVTYSFDQNRHIGVMFIGRKGGTL